MKHVFLTLILCASLMAGETKNFDFNTTTRTEYTTSQTDLTEDEMYKRVLYTNLIGAAVVTTWGVIFWDYFSSRPILGDEGWFQHDTKSGGADKLGHMHSTHLWAWGFASLYEYWGMKEEESMIYGPLTAWLFQGIMEVGDSFSASQGFSYEDFVMNTVGAGFYYISEKYPAVKEKLDLRLEYVPNFHDDVDIFTQYNSMKYLFALKFSGFDSMKSSFLRYGEFHLGYYTRGYQNAEAYTQQSRVIYVGVGINVSEVLKDMGWIKTSKVFNYFQLPFTSVPVGYDFDSNSIVGPYSEPYFGHRR